VFFLNDYIDGYIFCLEDNFLELY